MRKNWKVSLIGVVLLIIVLLCACGTKAEDKIVTPGFRLDYITGWNDVDVYRDAETKVQYLIYRDTSSYAGMGGICPRYNYDGSLYVD